MLRSPHVSPHACKPGRPPVREPDGFALPSVLFLVSLLTTLILILVFAEFFRRSFAYRELSKVKANIAAQNGIVWCVANGTRGSTSVPLHDGTASDVTAYPWGVYQLAVSNGSSGNSTAEYAALLAQNPDVGLSVALEFSNDRHQLVFAGGARIVGDLHVGKPGVTTGTLPGGRSPSKAPVSGKTTRGGEFMKFDFARIEKQIAGFNARLGTGNNIPKAADSSSVKDSAAPLDLNASRRDSSSRIMLEGNYRLSGALIRRGAPLDIYVRGTVTFAPGTYIYGPVRIVSTGPIVIPPDAHLEYAIIYSRSSIEVLSTTGSKVQLISPKVALGSGARLSYPSSIVSYVFQTDNAKGEGRKITLMEDCEIDGSVLMNARAVQLNTPELIVIGSASKVVGSVYCGEKMTIDGEVIGTVMTEDFYFYESPTRYYGWMRGGVIDRASLPASYLVPIGFETPSLRLEVLDWI